MSGGSAYDRRAMFQTWNQQTPHQRMAGLASWAAYSARWRAHQGLPLLHAMDVQYLSPHDFCNGLGHPLAPAAQRRRFRQYVEAAIRQGVAYQVRSRAQCAGNLGAVRAHGFDRWVRALRPDYRYGREDVEPYAPRALSPVRPYGVPVVSDQFAEMHAYWLDGEVVGDDEDDLGDDSWMETFRG